MTLNYYGYASDVCPFTFMIHYMIN